MSQSELKHWPMLQSFDKEFMANIKMVMIYGDYAHKALVVFKDDSVYQVDANFRIANCDKGFSSLWKPAKVEELSNKGVKSFVCGREYGLAALTDKGEVYYWRWHESDDQCNMEAARPTRIGACFYEESIVQISCGNSRLIALTKDGEVLRHDGVRTDIMLQSLCSIKPLADPVKYNACDRCNVLCKIIIVKIACAHSHTLALSKSGDVYVWGSNAQGQFGNGTTCDSGIAVKIPSTLMGKVADIAAISTSHMSAVLTRTRQVFAWGPCRGHIVLEPILTPFSTLDEVFAAYAHPNVMYSSVILGDEENEDENKGETNILDSLRAAFDDPTNSDFAIKVEGKPIHVHKSVLRIRSVYFQSMFKEQWTENNQSIFEHNDFPYDVYKSFLKYLYTGEIDVQDGKLMELLALANAYCELQLKQRCAQILGQGIEVSNVSRLYDVAVTHGSTELEDLCVEFASNHMSVIALSPQFSELSPERAKALTIKAAAKGTF